MQTLLCPFSSKLPALPLAALGYYWEKKPKTTNHNLSVTQYTALGIFLSQSLCCRFPPELMHVPFFFPNPSLTLKKKKRSCKWHSEYEVTSTSNWCATKALNTGGFCKGQKTPDGPAQVKVSAKATVARFKHWICKFTLLRETPSYEQILRHTLEEWLYLKSKWCQRLLNESQEQSVTELVFPNIQSIQTEQMKSNYGTSYDKNWVTWSHPWQYLRFSQLAATKHPLRLHFYTNLAQQCRKQSFRNSIEKLCKKPYPSILQQAKEMQQIHKKRALPKGHPPKLPAIQQAGYTASAALKPTRRYLHRQ